MLLPQFDIASKIWFHPEWLEAYLRGEAVAPISVEMDLTNRCNYSCPNCVWGAYLEGDRSHVCIEQALSQVSGCAEAGVKAIVFSGGGEPLLNHATPIAIQHASELGLKVGLLTNGLLLKQETIDILVENCEWIRIHLDGVTPSIYHDRHGLSSDKINTIKNNLYALNASVKNHNSKLSVGIGSVINKSNIADIENLASLAFSSGCAYFQAKHDFELLNNSAYMDWWELEVVSILEALQSKYKDTGFKIQYTAVDYTKPPQATRCHIHHLTTAITADGDVAFCKRLRDKPQWATGNVRKEALSVILNSEQNKRLSEDINPQNCGIQCPYIALNELLEEITLNDEPRHYTELDSPQHLPFF